MSRHFALIASLAFGACTASSERVTGTPDALGADLDARDADTPDRTDPGTDASADLAQRSDDLASAPEASGSPDALPGCPCPAEGRCVDGRCAYTVTFESGEDAPSEPVLREVLLGDPYGPLPEPDFTDHTLLGWFTAPDGLGFRVTAETLVTRAEDHTLHAYWRPVLAAAFDFVILAPTTFAMGSPESEFGRGNEPLHQVTLTRSLAVLRTEVTQGHWKLLSGGVNPACFQDLAGTACSGTNANDFGPIERIDWFSAVAFTNALSLREGLAPCYTLVGCTDPPDGWRDGAFEGCTDAVFSGPACPGYRLPTEAEWEYAARGGTTTATPLGEILPPGDCTVPQPNLDPVAWWCLNSGDAGGPSKKRTHRVGSKAPNPFGLHDMLGNVWEITSNWAGDYTGDAIDPTGPPTGLTRVTRGGGFEDVAIHLRSGLRYSARPPDFRKYSGGFRIVRTMPESPDR